MTAPTEAEIREAMAEGLWRIGGKLTIDDAGVWDALAVFMDSDEARTDGAWSRGFSPPVDHPGTLWANMRPSETVELKDPLEEIVGRVEDAASEMLTQLVIEHVIAFAAKYPDIPRGAWRQAVPA
jgi:hypothetical protein